MSKQQLKLSWKDEILLQRLQETGYIVVEPGSKLEKTMQKLVQNGNARQTGDHRYISK